MTDELIEVKATEKESGESILVTRAGNVVSASRKPMCVPPDEPSMGVIGMSLNDQDEIVGMQLDHQGDSLLYCF